MTCGQVTWLPLRQNEIEQVELKIKTLINDEGEIRKG